MVLAGAGCSEKVSTAPDLGFLQIDPRTVEVVIPYEDFVQEIQVFGGYGSANDFGGGVVALDLDGLNARTLVHLLDYPTSVVVRGTDGVARTDTDITFVGAHVLVQFDTVVGTAAFPAEVGVSAATENWHLPSVTWEAAVDTAGDRRLWAQAGGSPTTVLGVGIFDRHLAQVENIEADLVDTVSIAIDSAGAAILTDPARALDGLVLSSTEAGTRLDVLDVSLILSTVPSTKPDTTIFVLVPMQDLVFITDPIPPPPTGWLRVGGTPSWRSVITMLMPRSVDGTAELCGTPGCQVDLTDVDLNLAELVLTSRQTEPAFQPRASMTIDVRPVLVPELLPKSPLGESLVPIVERLPPELFSGEAGSAVRLAVTDMVRNILASGPKTDTEPDVSMALFSVVEPNLLGFGSFEGGGGAGAPVLRLVFTVANEVRLP